MIPSMLDNDLYKFTMMQAVGSQHGFLVPVEYTFKCRSDIDIDWNGVSVYINDGIERMNSLEFKNDELEYLESLGYLKSEFIQSLKYFRYDINMVDYKVVDNAFNLTVSGPWFYTILFEVPLLAIISVGISSVRLQQQVFIGGRIGRREQLLDILNKKLEVVKNTPIKFADFGTRRRYSDWWHSDLVAHLIREIPDNFIGTSNVYLAKEYGITPIGTMAHEWIMAHQQLGYRLDESQKMALEHWVKEYRGDLGIALTDTIGIDAFLHDFDLYFCKLFDGVRHDSGSPDIFGEKVVHHYQKMGIDPMSKTVVFSDGLTFPEMQRLYYKFSPRIKVAFGIGTNLTNDLGSGYKAPNIVIKMTKCNNQPVAKISDSPGKIMCEDKEYVAHLKKVFDIID